MTEYEGWTYFGLGILLAVTAMAVSGIVFMGHNGVDIFQTCIEAGNEWVKGVCLLP